MTKEERRAVLALEESADVHTRADGAIRTVGIPPGLIATIRSRNLGHLPSHGPDVDR